MQAGNQNTPRRLSTRLGGVFVRRENYAHFRLMVQVIVVAEDGDVSLHSRRPMLREDEIYVVELTPGELGWITIMGTLHELDHIERLQSCRCPWQWQ